MRKSKLKVQLAYEKGYLDALIGCKWIIGDYDYSPKLGKKVIENYIKKRENTVGELQKQIYGWSEYEEIK